MRDGDDLGGKWRFLKFNDWSNAGHPFDPVKEDFMTFVIGEGKPVDRVPVMNFNKIKNLSKKATEWSNWTIAESHLTVSKGTAGRIIPKSTALTFAKGPNELQEFSLVAGECEYIGREGIEFYPQELLLFRFDALGPKVGTVWLRNIQAAKSKYKVQPHRVLLETTYLYPLVKGPEMDKYKHGYTGLIAAFPYEESEPLKPVSADHLRERSPLLFNYYQNFRELFEKQTKFSDKIRGANPGEFYGLARTGPYSFANKYVGYRDNTRWCATVISSTELPWGERKRFVFQNHAVSMCERQCDGQFIDEDEAHYICAILNTPIVERFINATSDNRSFKIRPPVFVPQFDLTDDRHMRLASISRALHENPSHIHEFCNKAEEVYLAICADEVNDIKIAENFIRELNTDTNRLVSGKVLETELNRLI